MHGAAACDGCGSKFKVCWLLHAPKNASSLRVASQGFDPRQKSFKAFSNSPDELKCCSVHFHLQCSLLRARRITCRGDLTVTLRKKRIVAASSLSRLWSTAEFIQGFLQFPRWIKMSFCTFSSSMQPWTCENKHWSRWPDCTIAKKKLIVTASSPLSRLRSAAEGIQGVLQFFTIWCVLWVVNRLGDDRWRRRVAHHCVGGLWIIIIDIQRLSEVTRHFFKPCFFVADLQPVNTNQPVYLVDHPNIFLF